MSIDYRSLYNSSSSPIGFPSFGLALTGTTETSYPNFVFPKDSFRPSIIFYLSTSVSNKSTLFKTIISFYIIISPKIIHSDVWVWMPLLSTTKIIKSMIEAPPITVHIKDAWPGQSTKVIYRCVNFSSFGECLSLNQSGIFITKAENPKSKVIPLSVLYLDLSKPAVEPIVESAFERDVFPESIWPSIPMLKLKVVDGSKSGSLLSIQGIDSNDASIIQY